MTAPSTELPLHPVLAAGDQPDLTGRSRLVSNVLFSWAAHCVFIVAGFIMPRMIDRRLGQELLGIWDFSWSLIGYFSLVQLGIGGSVGRYVARYRAMGDLTAVNRAVSSVACILLIMAMCVVALTGVLIWLVLPGLVSSELGSNLGTVCWVVGLLGVEVAIQIFFSCYSGVLTGCHRWEIYNSIQTGGYALTVVGMIVALLLGGGLRSLALLHLGGSATAWVIIAFAAHRSLPGLRVRPQLVQWKEAVAMLHFGLKSFMAQAGELLLNQTVAVLIVAYLGPAALAIYSRPRSLVHHIRILVSKMSSILIPSASSLQTMNQGEEIRSVVIKATRYAAYLTLPIASIVAVMGGVILQLWMGLDYRADLVPPILAIGAAIMIIMSPALSVLVGMNLHGLPSLVHCLGCVMTVGVVWIWMVCFDAGIVGVAACASLPLTLIYAFYMPLRTARSMGLSVFRFLTESLLAPILAVTPLIACLVVARWVFATSPIRAFSVGCMGGAIILIPIYWQKAIPRSLKAKVLSSLNQLRPAKQADDV